MPLPDDGIKYSALPAAGPLDGTEKFPVVQGGVTKTALTGTFVLKVDTQLGTQAAPTSKEIWRFNAPAGDTHGPFNMVVGGSAFGGFFDRVMYFGYNVADGGGRAVNSEPSFRFSIESDYFDGTNRLVEPYFEWAKGPNPSRSVTDGVTTNGSTTVTSTTAAFTTADVGVPITGAGIPANTRIAARNSATSIVLSAAATATAAGVTLTLTPTAQQRRPIFMQIDRNTGEMRAFDIRVPSIALTSWDDDTVVWGSLSPGGLILTPKPGQTCQLVLNDAGGVNFIQMGNGAFGFLLQPTAAGSDIWRMTIGGTGALGVGPRGAIIGEQNINFSGTVTAMVPAARKDDTSTYYGQAAIGQTTSMLRMRSANAAADLFVTDPAPAGTDETVIRTWINGALKRIVVGAADSAGVGFRALRVAN